MEKNFSLLRQQLADKDAEIERLRGMIVMRFDHEVPPQFEQGYSEHEVLEPVTAEHCRWFVGEIEALRQQLADKETQRVNWMMQYKRQGDNAQAVINELRQQLAEKAG